MFNISKKGKITFLILLLGLVYGGIVLVKKLFPTKAKDVTVTTKATSLPPLAYDKNSNAVFREIPSTDQSDVQSPQIRGKIMEWYSQLGMIYSVGGKNTTKGSIAEELGLNINLDVQNNCGKQAEELYLFAQELSKGNPNPSAGAHFIAWMGDGVPSYFYDLNNRLKKDFGDEYIAQVVYFGGASAGEDKWLVKKKFAKDARGSLTATVIRDGD